MDTDNLLPSKKNGGGIRTLTLPLIKRPTGRTRNRENDEEHWRKGNATCKMETQKHKTRAPFVLRYLYHCSLIEL
jgi:hypothetical protein